MVCCKRLAAALLTHQLRAQVPRLTAMLRAFATENGSLNADALYLERQAALQRRRAKKPVAEVHNPLCGRPDLVMLSVG